MTFTNVGSAKITAKFSDSTNKITIAGVTTEQSLTVEDAVTNINKLLGIINKTVVAKNMTRSITQEATE